jgi:hypothetical protein
MLAAFIRKNEMINAREAVERLPKMFPRWMHIEGTIYSSNSGGTTLFIHVCQPLLVYERLSQLPPKPVGHLTGILGDKDRRLVCSRCGHEVSKKVEMIARLRKIKI